MSTYETRLPMKQLLDDCTPGPWVAWDHKGWAHPYVSVCDSRREDIIRMRDGRAPDDISIIGPTFMTRGKVEIETANAVLIARCNPETMAKVLALLTQISESHDSPDNDSLAREAINLLNGFSQ